MPKSQEFVAWESGHMRRGGPEEVSFFQRITDAGQIEELPAKYLRRAMELDQAGEIDLYGNED